MSSNLNQSNALTPAQWREVDDVCDRFEAAWRAGKQPRVEDYLSEIGSEIEDAVIKELLVMDAAYLQRSGVQPDADELVRRFPGHAATITRLQRSDPAGDLGDQSTAHDDSSVDALNSRAAPVDTLRHFELLEQIGSGGMGVVYKARDRRLDRYVAIKFLSIDRRSHPDAVNRFEREMKAVGKLNHPNIVHAHLADEEDGTPFLVTEFVDGFDLSALVHRLGPIAVGEACAIIDQALLALQHAHEHGIVHRDIKPSNLLVRNDGQVKLTDLGLALVRSTSRQSADAMTQTGEVVGTLDYISPEQFQDTRTVDIRADLYSLGCTCYWLLTGHAPFPAPRYLTMYAKMRAHIESAPTPIAEYRTDVPPELAEWVSRMMAKAPSDRFANPSEAREAVGPFAKSQHLAALMSRAASLPESVTRQKARLPTQDPAQQVKSGKAALRSSNSVSRTLYAIIAVLAISLLLNLVLGARTWWRFNATMGPFDNCVDLEAVLDALPSPNQLLEEPLAAKGNVVLQVTNATDEKIEFQMINCAVLAEQLSGDSLNPFDGGIGLISGPYSLAPGESIPSRDDFEGVRGNGWYLLMARIRGGPWHLYFEQDGGERARNLFSSEFIQVMISKNGDILDTKHPFVWYLFESTEAMPDSGTDNVGAVPEV